MAATRLHRTRQFAFDSLLLALASVVLTALAWFQARSAFVPLLLLTGGECVVAVCAYYWSLDHLQRVALDPVMKDIPEVREYCTRLAHQSERKRLARCIDSMIKEASVPGSFVLPDRIAMVEEQLRMLARQLASRDITVQPRSLITCLRLLSRGVESPLFNAKVPIEDLHAALHRIRSGFGRDVAATRSSGVR